MTCVAGTHAAIWYLWAPEELSAAATRTFDEALGEGIPIGISAIAICEIVYLAERGRIRTDAFDRMLDAVRAGDSPFQVLQVDLSVAIALANEECRRIPKMPDRIIAATAQVANVPLVDERPCNSRIGVSGELVVANRGPFRSLRQP